MLHEACGQGIHLVIPVANPWAWTNGLEGMQSAAHWHWQERPLQCMAAHISIAISKGLCVVATIVLAGADSVVQQTNGPSLSTSSSATVSNFHDPNLQS